MNDGKTSSDLLNKEFLFFNELTKTNSQTITSNDELETLVKLRNKADKAFHNGNFKKAYKLYNEALKMNPDNYDLIACSTGAALNLSHMDEVFEKCDLLIALDSNKAQGYYLKGLASDLIYKFDLSIDLYFKALDYEQEHSKIIIRNLIKSITSYLNINDPLKQTEAEINEIDCLLRLVQLCDDLIKNRKNMIAIKIINYIQSLEIENFSLKTQYLYFSGKLLKSEGEINKALVAFEECLYLGSLHEDNKVKIKAIVSVSSCYLEMGDLHKVIYYYHKLIDIEKNLEASKDNTDSMDQFSDDLISLELRIAIRQNLFTAHHRLGKLRICCYYLNEIIDILNKKFNLNNENLIAQNVNSSSLFESFEFIQIKMDATVELIKLYILFEEFINLNELLTNMLNFVEIICIKHDEDKILTLTQINSLRYFKIKCYSYFGICLAGLRNFRYSRICTKKSLSLIDKEIDAKAISALNTADDIKKEVNLDGSNDNELKILNLLKIECLLDAADACAQQIKTYKDIRNKSDKIPYDNNQDPFNIEEKISLMEMYNKHIEYSKSSYMLSKLFIDPNLRVQTTFNLALSLYENELYQSASYYFKEVLSISKILINNNLETNISNNSGFNSDVQPDHSLEANVYLAKCQLLIDYYQINVNESGEDLKLSNKESSTDFQPVEFENLYRKLNTSNETLTHRILKWKLHETNRASFLFNIADIEKLKNDRESLRLRKVFKICNECLIYICFKLNKIQEALIHIEKSEYLLNTDSIDIIENKYFMATNGNSTDLSYFNNYENLRSIFVKLDASTLHYKFIFNQKLLAIIFVEKGSGDVTFHNLIKMSQLLNDFTKSLDESSHVLLADSLIESLFNKFKLIENEWVKKNLNKIESMDILFENSELEKIRERNRNRERNYYYYLKNGSKDSGIDVTDAQFKMKFYMHDLDLLSLVLSKTLKESSDESSCFKSVDTPRVSKNEKETLNNVYLNILKIFEQISIQPIESLLTRYSLMLTSSNTTDTINIVVDSKYSKLFVSSFNNFNQKNSYKLSYLIILDSHLSFAVKLLDSIEKYDQEDKQIESMRQEVIKPQRFTQQPDPKGKQLKIPKSMITPRHTSHPRLAVNLINEDPDKDYILIRNDHVEKLKNRLDCATGVLISETITGTNAKRSYLEVIDFKQIHNTHKCCVIGCPELPSRLATNYHSNRFLTNGFEQMRTVSKLLNTEPIFSSKMTKFELINQLQSSTIIFLSTYSTNESNSALVCAENKEYPSSSTYEFEKYCKFTSNDLNLIDMFRCDLLILNLYSVINNKERINLAKKFISRGCKCALIVLTPLPDQLMNQFYSCFFENVQKLKIVNEAYIKAIESLNSQNDVFSENIIRSAFCLLGAKSIKISLTDIGKSMLHLKVDNTLGSLNSEHDKNYLNLDEKFSVLSPSYASSLEKTLSQLQLITKFLLNQLITDVGFMPLKKSFSNKRTFIYLNDLISKSIFYIKAKRTNPEQAIDLVDENRNLNNLLKCLGFSIQRKGVTKIRDQKDKSVIIFPDQRYLDLNLRMTHVLTSLIELCFDKVVTKNSDYELNSISDDNESESSSDQSEFSNRINNLSDNDTVAKSVIFNLQALLPIDDKNLLAYLIDILAFTKFSPEILLSLSDHSIFYALNFYQIQTKLNSRSYVNLINENLDKWKYNGLNKSDQSKPMPTNTQPNLSIKYGINNKVANFLISIGYEIIGPWLRFNDTDYNRKLIDIMLKFLTSFTSDRDMSLYKELNINVLGERYSARSINRTASNLNRESLETSDKDPYQLVVTNPWCTLVETRDLMEKKIKFVEKYVNLTKKISRERNETVRNHLSYFTKQSILNIENIMKENKNDTNERSDQKTQDEQNANKPNELNNEIIKEPKTIQVSSNLLEKRKINKIKFKPGGGPSKDRVIENEKLNLTMDEINKIRQYSHLVCDKHIKKIEVEKKEKLQNLMLPLIKSLNTKYNDQKLNNNVK